jgi:TatD DNase family protein
MLYDTHAHINFAAFKEEYKELLESTLGQGVWVNNVGTQKDTSAAAVNLAQEFSSGIYAIVGLHPIHTLAQNVDEEESHFKTREEKFDYDYYRDLATESKVVGIGECGLDYYRLPEGMSIAEVRAIQEPVFREQIWLAKETGKALAIHCRASKDSFDAYDDIMEVLKSEGAGAKDFPNFEIHSFTADWSVCERFLNLGAYIGLNGIITFDKTGVLKTVTENCPLERIVLETDAPYLAPLPFRGKQNQPLYVKYVAEYIAQIKGLSVEEVSETTTSNAKKLFKLE